MTTMIREVYEAFREAGATEEKAAAAAEAVLATEERQHLATKADLADLKAEIQAMLNRQLQIMLGVMVALTAIYAAIVKLL